MPGPEDLNTEEPSGNVIPPAGVEVAAANNVPAEVPGTEPVAPLENVPLTPEQQGVVDAATEEEGDLSDEMTDELMEMLSDFIPDLEAFFASLIDYLEDINGDDDDADGENDPEIAATINLINLAIDDDGAPSGLIQRTSNGLYTAESMSEDDDLVTELTDLRDRGITTIYTTNAQEQTKVNEAIAANESLGMAEAELIPAGDSGFDLDNINYENLYGIYADGNAIIIGEESAELAMLMHAINTPGITFDQLTTAFGVDAEELDNRSSLEEFCDNQATIRTDHANIPQMPAEVVAPAAESVDEVADEPAAG